MSSFTLTFCPTWGVYSISMDEYEDYPEEEVGTHCPNCGKQWVSIFDDPSYRLVERDGVKYPVMQCSHGA